MRHHVRPAGIVLAAAAASFAGSGCADRPPESPSSADLSRPMVLTVDASGPAHGLFHTHMTIPARPGSMTLAYPEWIPGEHMPTGSVQNVVDLHVTAGGKTLGWRRDLEQMNEVVVTVPEGASTIDVDFDYVNAVGPITSTGDATSAHALTLEWSRLLMYPKGPAVSALRVDAHVKLPAGWSQASALDVSGSGGAGGGIDFRQVSLETLVDSPLIAGEHLRTYDLGVQHGARHYASVVADSAEALAIPGEVVDGWKRLVVEAGALFGARHYDSYRFLLTLSDVVDGGLMGLEHHQSSLNGLPERGMIDEDPRRALYDLFPHEYAHSWDGKYRRPRGLATPDYQAPMHDDLLWVYEGLTQYLGVVLSARAGMAPLGDVKDDLASYSAYLAAPGRQWRPVIDTAIASQLLRETPTRGASLRRYQDYYVEGALVWLEADVLIRQRSQGARSLDDFCQRFFGGKDSGAMVKPYDLDEVVTTLNGVLAYDWRGFFDARIYQVAPRVPLGGIEGSGYRVVFVDKEPALFKATDSAAERTSYSYSLGFRLKNEGSTIGDVRVGSPAEKAGLISGGKLVAVDGRKYDATVMKAALARARSSKEPIELLVEDDDTYRTVKIDWHGGERYAALERDPSKPDLLEKILAPRVSKLPAPKADAKAGAK